MEADTMTRRGAIQRATEKGVHLEAAGIIEGIMLVDCDQEPTEILLLGMLSSPATESRMYSCTFSYAPEA
jgi:hypothetical protein